MRSLERARGHHAVVLVLLVAALQVFFLFFSRLIHRIYASWLSSVASLLLASVFPVFVGYSRLLRPLVQCTVSFESILDKTESLQQWLTLF